MKKILLMISILLTLGLMGCSSTPSPTDEPTLEELEQEIIEMQERMDNIEYILDILGIITGLNNQRSYYIPPEEAETIDSLFKGVSAETEQLVSGLDKSKLPDYLFDDIGNPVEFDDVGNLLLDKYYGNEFNSDFYGKVGFQTKMRFTITDEDMSTDEMMARTILMIEELSLYEYWLIGGSELYLQIRFNSSNFEMFIYMPNLLSDAFNLTPSDYYNEHWEIEITNISFNLETTQAYYIGFIQEESFTGTVLNYN